MNLFQKTPVFSLSLLFWLHEVGVQDTCISFLSHLLISLFPVIYFDLSITRIPDNSNSFRFTQKVLVIRSWLYVGAYETSSKKFFFRYVFSPKSLFIFIYYLRQRRHQHHCFKNQCASSVSIAWRNWTYSEEICNKVSVYRVNIVLKSWKSVCTEKDGHAASEAVTVAGRRAGVGSGSGVGCGSDLSSERTWARYAWHAF